MATYTFTGEQTMVFPSLSLTLNPGDSFDAPADFVAEDVTAGKTKKVASIIEPEIDLTPVEPTPDPAPVEPAPVEPAPETAPATIEEAPAPAIEGTN